MYLNTSKRAVFSFIKLHIKLQSIGFRRDSGHQSSLCILESENIYAIILENQQEYCILLEGAIVDKLVAVIAADIIGPCVARVHHLQDHGSLFVELKEICCKMHGLGTFNSQAYRE